MIGLVITSHFYMYQFIHNVAYLVRESNDQSNQDFYSFFQEVDDLNVTCVI